MPKVTTNPKLSSRYLERLRKYTDVNLVTPTRRFCCADYKRCKASLGPGHGFGPGQMSYVGPHYAAAIGRQAVQILVVSMQVGDKRPVTLDQRSVRVRSRIDMTPGERNAHMRAVTLALQLLWGQPPDAGYENLPGTDVHVLDAYAMANASLCSDLPTGGASRRGAPTKTMLENCSRHLEATVKRLESTIIHTQGRRAFAGSSIFRGDLGLAA